MVTMKKFVVVDGSSYLFRAYHALPPLMNSKGTPTGAIFGVLNMLKKLLNEEKPDYFAVIFDTKSKNFRHELYKEYKANRAEMAQDLQVQIQPLHDIIRAMGMPLIAVDGVEADDVIATLALQATQHQVKTVISTGDKDMAQCVNENVTLVNTMTGLILNEEGVFAKFGVRPNQIIDYLALIGDSSDNIPGIPKVGPKTAAGWLKTYDTVENIIENAKEIKGKVGEYLRENIELLQLGKKLVTVQEDVPLPLKVEDLIIQQRDPSKLKTIYQELEFKNWIKELERPTVEVASVSVPSKEKGEYEVIWDFDHLNRWIKRFSEAKAFVIDVETTSLDAFDAELVGISFTDQTNQGAYIPLAHDYPNCPPQLDKTEVLNLLRPLLESKTIAKIGHHIKYDMHIFSKYGIELQNVTDDTMLESYVLNSTATNHGMNSLAKTYLEYQTIQFEDIAGKGAKQITFDKIDIPTASHYAAEDADITMRLHEVLSDKLAQAPSLLPVYRDIEIPLIRVLWQMEQCGVCIDSQLLEEQSIDIGKRLQALEEEAHILAGQSFNLGSPKQLQEILYDKLSLPIMERTPKGAPSTAESVLQTLSQEYELPKLLLTHRTLSKIKSTYTDKLPDQVNFRTKRVHTSYHQAVTATGRLSSTNPNLQNIPIRTEEGRKIRQAIIAAPGHVLISADYSQIELRIMAHISKDEGLLRAFSQKIDIHKATASEIFGVPLDEVKEEHRRSAKAINFGLIYGMSAFGLSAQLHISRGESQAYMDLYFQRYPGVKQYMQDARVTAEQQGYVETIFGRRLYLPEIRAKHMGRKKAAERAAINAPMQGSAADIIKRAMIAIAKEITGDQDIKMIMQVHDELVFEVRASQVERAKKIIVEGMQNTTQLAVPLEVSVGVGLNWDLAH